MKIQSLFLLSIICFFCTGVFAEETATATGLCKDGTPYTGKSKRGACRGHGGVKEWYGKKSAATTATPATSAGTPATASPEPTPATEPALVTPASSPASTPAVAPKAQPNTSQKAAIQMPPAGSDKVWVNTHSKIYHCEGSKFYGKTKNGEFMTEADAQAKGYIANHKKLCKK